MKPIPRPKSEVTVVFIAITIMLIAFASIGYFYLTTNQDNLMKTLQAHDDKLVKLLHHLNITDND